MQKIRKNKWSNFEKNTKNLIFGLFLAVFGHFWPNSNFPKKSGSVSFVPLWYPNFMQKIRKNKWANSEKSVSLTDWLTDGQTDGSNFIGPSWTSFGSKIRKNKWSNFEKNPKNLILGVFGPVLAQKRPNGFFSEKSGDVSFHHLWSPDFMQKIRKK